ncbi:MAG TPA: TolC family protein [Bryobacteraceae bacterium]|nr:TolC family protein [Bryobacteraceae bacterium]
MSSRTVFLPILLCAAAGTGAAAEPSNITILPPKPHTFGFLTRPFQQRGVPSANLGNSPRMEQLFRGGNLYLTAQDVVALTLENNIDIETQRYGPLLALEDLRRAQVGGALRNPTTPVAAGPQSVSLAGINISTSLASGAGVGSSGGITGLIGSLVPQTDPILTLSASFGHSTYPESNIIVDQTNALVQTNQSFSASYSQQFLPGTAVNLSFISSRYTVNSPSTILNPYTTGSINLNISQNLLQGWGIAVNNRYIRIARNNVKVTDLQLKQQVTTTISAVLNLYWDLVAFNEDVRLKKQALDAARQLFEDNRKELGAGAVAAIEVTRSQAEIPAREQDVLIAETNVLQQEIVLKNAISRHGIQDPILETAHIIPLDHTEVPQVEDLGSVHELISQAMQQRADLEQSRLNIQSQGLVLLGDKSELKPSLQAFLSFTNHAQVGVPNPLNVGYQYGTPDPFYIGGSGTFLGQLFRRNFPDYAAGFSLTIPIRNRAAQADYATDMLQMRQQQLQLEKASNQVAVDVRNAVVGLQQAHRRYQTAEDTRKLADETLAAERKKYEFGKSTNAAVIQAQRDVVTAESEEVQAMANYTHARIAFEQALGVTLDKNNITMAEASSGQVERKSSPPASLPERRP